jgi:AsmA protein
MWRGKITQLVSQWKIKDGVAEATDCALATQHHRVALKGKLNLVNERYDNVIVALLGDKGCAQQQSITGSFGTPKVGAVSVVESFADPILHHYGKAKRFVQGGKCEVFITVPWSNPVDTLLGTATRHFSVPRKESNKVWIKAATNPSQTYLR